MPWTEITIGKTTYERDQPKEIKKLQKRKATRLKGRKLIALYKKVYDRDKGCCVHCGRWIEPGTIPHHIEKKSHLGSDTMDNLQMLCPVCHGRAHNINVIGEG